MLNTDSKIDQRMAESVGQKRGWRGLWPWLIALLGAIVVLSTYRHYGITWDEGGQAYYGELALRAIRHIPLDAGGEHLLSIGFVYYGPLLEMIPCLIHGADESGLYEVRHLFFGLLALLVIPGLAMFTRRAGLPWLGLCSILAVVTMPGYFGHWTNNSKDIPFATAVVWYMAALVALAGSPRLTWSRILVAALALGLALCARPGGLPLLGLFLIGAMVIGHRTAQGPKLVGDGRSMIDALMKFATMFIIAWGIMVLPWPWAHAKPIRLPLEAVSYSINFRRKVPVLFDGNEITSLVLPWNYLLELILITTPPLVLSLAAVGLAVSIRWQFTQRKSRRALICTMTQMWLLAPIALFMVQRPAIYDGMRHFLFVLPALGVMAGIGATGMIELLRNRTMRAVAVVAAIAILLLPVKELIRLHPYETTYFNIFAGGLPGASRRYDIDYWAASYGEAMQWVNQQAALRPDRRVRVLAAGPEYLYPCAANHKAENVDVKMIEPPADVPALPEGVDYYIGCERFHYAEKFPGSPIVHSVGRDGVVFTVVRARGG